MEQEAPIRRLALLVEYEGGAYGGSQYQKNAPTIQAELEKALSSLTGESIRLAMAGRTDAGVHAKGQVASFLTRSGHSPHVFVRGTNYHLPEDIAVRRAAEVPLGFQVRREARSRHYRYTIFNGAQRSPLWRRYAWQVSEPLDVAAMQEACRCLLGEHDFAAFTQPSLTRRQRTVRLIHRVELKRRGPLVLLDMEANAFLPQQVRRTVAALVQVGASKLSAGQFSQLVDTPRPGAAALTAPPHGLCLMRVHYDRELFDNETDEDL